VPDLARDAGGGRQLMAEGIEGLGFSFAFEGGTPHELARDPATDEVIWAVDSDGDNDLDFDVVAGAALPVNIDLEDIRAVRIQILGRTSSETLGLEDETVYELGRRTYGPGQYNNRHQHRYLSSTVKCRNLGL
jgi:type IV pilus assembly protein PilW